MSLYHACGYVDPAARRQARRELAAAQAARPLGAVTAAAIIQALSHRGPDDYFITTRLYWECDCPDDRFRPQGMACCEDCGSFADDRPDARIHELRRMNIHLDYHDPAVRDTMDEHNLQARQARPAA